MYGSVWSTDITSNSYSYKWNSIFMWMCFLFCVCLYTEKSELDLCMNEQYLVRITIGRITISTIFLFASIYQNLFILRYVAYLLLVQYFSIRWQFCKVCIIVLVNWVESRHSISISCIDYDMHVILQSRKRFTIPNVQFLSHWALSSPMQEKP